MKKNGNTLILLLRLAIGAMFSALIMAEINKSIVPQ